MLYFFLPSDMILRFFLFIGKCYLLIHQDIIYDAQAIYIKNELVLSKSHTITGLNGRNSLTIMYGWGLFTEKFNQTNVTSPTLKATLVFNNIV